MGTKGRQIRRRSKSPAGDFSRSENPTTSLSTPQTLQELIESQAGKCVMPPEVKRIRRRSKSPDVNRAQSSIEITHDVAEGIKQVVRQAQDSFMPKVAAPSENKQWHVPHSGCVPTKAPLAAQAGKQMPQTAAVKKRPAGSIQYYNDNGVEKQRLSVSQGVYSSSAGIYSAAMSAEPRLH